MAEPKKRKQGFQSSRRSAQQGFESSWRSAQQGFETSWRSAQQGFESSWRSAQQGFESSWRSAQQGFTLIELMVVLVILGLAATAVVLAMPEPGGSLAGEADRFAARAKAARDTAILESRAVAVQIGRGGYEVARRRQGAWQTEARHEWAERTAPDLPGAAPVSIRFDSTGSAEPARIVLRRGDDQAVIDVAGDGNVHVRR